jgi:serine/threonine protein kinase/WD40 repeat protein
MESRYEKPKLATIQNPHRRAPRRIPAGTQVISRQRRPQPNVVVNSSSDDSLLARLFALPMGERARLWEKACVEDPGLRVRLPEIARLLAKSDLTAPAVSAPPAPDDVVRALVSALEPAERESVGSLIGSYKLLQKIGEGGFGSVWMAEQLEPIRRRVALKIVKVGMDTDEVIARFEVERQALALMDHPNIARVFDAGATATGRPYFVMELVRGIAITRYCDDNRLTADARLRLFVAVCQAVQHAHQKGVIHRDLKPSNILVTLADGVPIPKVIDFGIAKATGKRLTDKTLITQFHAFVGTPAYTSPEQMDMSTLDVDTRADVYSLGVLLYELLAGRPPFDPEALMKSGLDAMRRMIREVDPPRPSSRLDTLSQAERTSVAQARATDATRLSVVLRGDLDWIAMRCLEKDRTRRYETANSLADDVQRFLADEPITARPPSNLYRLGKVARRHRVAFIASAAVAISVVAGLIVSSLLYWGQSAALTRAEVAEKSETTLRLAAEVGRAKEIERAARTALEQANRDLEEDRVPDGLAWLVQAARKDPFSPVLAPRIASVLASHAYLLPDGAPVECGSRVVATRFTRDGSRFFVGTIDGMMRVFDAASGRLVQEIPTGRPVKRFGGFQFARANDAVFAARFDDETRVDDNALAVFDVATGKPIGLPLRAIAPSPNDSGINDSMGLSPDGRWAYAINWDGFYVRDVATGDVRIKFLWGGGPKQSDYDISADSRHVLLAIGGKVHVWSLSDGKPLGKPLAANLQPGRVLARFTPDGERIAVFEISRGIHLFGLDGAALGEPIPCTEIVGASGWEFMPDGRLLIVSGKSARMLDPKTRRSEPLPFARSGSFSSRDFNQDGTRLLTFDTGESLRLWDTTNGTLAAAPVLQPSSYSRIALSPDGRHIVIGTALGRVQRLRVTHRAARPLVLPSPAVNQLPLFISREPGRIMLTERERTRVIDVASARQLPGGFEFPHSITVAALALRGDLAFLITPAPAGGWEVWEFGPSGLRVVALRDSPREAATVRYNGFRNRVLLGTRSEIRVWDLGSGEPAGPAIANRPNGPDAFPTVRFSPEGERFVLTGAGVANVLDISSGRELVRFQPMPMVMTNPAVFSPDGTRVVTTVRAGEARLWDVATGASLGPVLLHPDALRDPLFSRDGRFFVTHTETEIRFWDGRTSDPLGAPLGVKANGTVQLSSDDERMLVTSNTGSARLWHVRTRHSLTEAMVHRSRVNYASLSPNGRFALIHADRPYIWPVPPSQPAGDPVPEWLLELATAHAGKSIDGDGKFVPVTDVTRRLDTARSQLARLPVDAPLAEWGQWILDDRADRPIAPGFTATEADAKKLLAELAAAGPRP